MRTTTIYLSPSYGNGWASLVQRHSDGHELWLQDDDAHSFREELDNTNECWSSDNAISEYDAVSQPSQEQE